MHPPVEKHRIHLPLRAHFLELVNQRGFSDEIAPALPKSILNLYLTTFERLPTNIHDTTYMKVGSRKEG
jgi:hypothetical protein